MASANQRTTKEKTAFRTSSGQLFEFNQLPFGLCNAPATFSRLMDRTLTGLAWNICLYYLDDIIVFAKTWEEHLERLKVVFQRLREANLKLGSAKCNLAQKEVSFLGYKVTSSGLEPDTRLMEAISKISPPTSVTEVRSFLGLIGYYRRFIKSFSDKAAPLNRLLHKDHPWEWTTQCQEAFELLKKEILKKPVSAFPDFQKPFRLYTDASNIGLGAILAQNRDGKECIICCASRTLNQAETNYSATKKECLAIVWGIQTFRPFLIATKFEVITDHYSLQWLRTMKNESALLHRWAAALEDFQFVVLHRPGKQQGHVDGLSRMPLHDHTFTVEGKVRVNDLEALDIIKAIHKEGHLGVKKTWKAFNRRYVTDQGRSKCQEVVKTCLECQLGKDYKQVHAPKGSITSPKPWDMVSIDIMGPFPPDNTSRRFIVTLLDVYSRYLIAVPVKDHTAQTVSKCFYEQVVAYFGVPRSILSDRGSEFTGAVWESLSDLLGTQIRLTSPYYPQGNALVERSHRTINNMLRTLILEQKQGSNWSMLLPTIMLYMNTMVQETSGYSSCEILFGKNPNLPSDIAFTPAVPIHDDREGYVKQLKKELGLVRQEINKQLDREKNLTENPFKIGDQVLIRLQPQELDSKIEAKWKGPFKVIRIPNKFQIEYQDDVVTRISHISYAKKFFVRCAHAWSTDGLESSVPPAAMAALRFCRGETSKARSRSRCFVFSMEQIKQQTRFHAGTVYVSVKGAKEDLPPDLRKILEAASPHGRIEGSVLLDLCGQRSDGGGGNCDAPVDVVARDLALSSDEEEGPPPAPAPVLEDVVFKISAKKRPEGEYSKVAPNLGDLDGVRDRSGKLAFCRPMLECKNAHNMRLCNDSDPNVCYSDRLGCISMNFNKNNTKTPVGGRESMEIKSNGTAETYSRRSNKFRRLRNGRNAKCSFRPNIPEIDCEIIRKRNNNTVKEVIHSILVIISCLFIVPMTYTAISVMTSSERHPGNREDFPALGWIRSYFPNYEIFRFGNCYTVQNSSKFSIYHISKSGSDLVTKITKLFIFRRNYCDFTLVTLGNFRDLHLSEAYKRRPSGPIQVINSLLSQALGVSKYDMTRVIMLFLLLFFLSLCINIIFIMYVYRKLLGYMSLHFTYLTLLYFLFLSLTVILKVSLYKIGFHLTTISLGIYKVIFEYLIIYVGLPRKIGFHLTRKPLNIVKSIVILKLSLYGIGLHLTTRSFSIHEVLLGCLMVHRGCPLKTGFRLRWKPFNTIKHIVIHKVTLCEIGFHLITRSLGIREAVALPYPLCFFHLNSFYHILSAYHLYFIVSDISISRGDLRGGLFLYERVIASHLCLFSLSPPLSQFPELFVLELASLSFVSLLRHGPVITSGESHIAIRPPLGASGTLPSGFHPWYRTFLLVRQCQLGLYLSPVKSVADAVSVYDTALG